MREDLKVDICEKVKRVEELRKEPLALHIRYACERVGITYGQYQGYISRNRRKERLMSLAT